MKQYDPDTGPNHAEWLALDEDEQIRIVSAYHKQSGAKERNPHVHAVAHVVVENQLAETIAVVQDALERLMAEGLDRHEAVHAVAAVLMDHLQRLMLNKAGEADAHERYFEDLRSLTVAVWHERYGRE